MTDLSTLEQRMDDVRAVMDAVDSERAVLFGMSEGATMAILFAATYPERTIALLTFGAFGGVITWVAGPSKGLLEVGQNGYLPPVFQRTNKNGVQVHILLAQGAMVTIAALAFVFMPNVSGTY